MRPPVGSLPSGPIMRVGVLVHLVLRSENRVEDPGGVLDLETTSQPRFDLPPGCCRRPPFAWRAGGRRRSLAERRAAADFGLLVGLRGSTGFRCGVGWLRRRPAGSSSSATGARRRRRSCRPCTGLVEIAAPRLLGVVDDARPRPVSAASMITADPLGRAGGEGRGPGMAFGLTYRTSLRAIRRSANRVRPGTNRASAAAATAGSRARGR